MTGAERRFRGNACCEPAMLHPFASGLRRSASLARAYANEARCEKDCAGIARHGEPYDYIPVDILEEVSILSR